MAEKFWNDIAINRIMECESGQIKDIIEYLGFSPNTFLRHANFEGVDIRGQDLSEINTELANFEGAISDHTTKLFGGMRPITDRDFVQDYITSYLYSFDWDKLKSKVYSDKFVSSINGASSGVVMRYNREMGNIGVINNYRPSPGSSKMVYVGREYPHLSIGIDDRESSLVNRIMLEMQGMFPSVYKDWRDAGGINKHRPAEKTSSFLNELMRRHLIGSIIVFFDVEKAYINQDDLLVISNINNIKLVREIIEDPIGFDIRNYLDFEIVYYDNIIDPINTMEKMSKNHLTFSNGAKEFMKTSFRTWDELYSVLIKAVIDKISNSNALPILMKSSDFN
ncbi:hypothetical protein [Sphingomonas sp. IBVSS2]|uniref:hypothetical protein n=1 Tax=Sphingomonas sp. IBVSS2 TaxID=1985172 RepID=UPI0011818603|nr:hypothetical protein [Sphingomonas sp. IBVSS2]